MKHTTGRMAWPLWIVSEGGRDIAVVAAPSAAEAIEVTGSRSMEVEAKRIGVADDGCVRVVRRLANAPVDDPSQPMGRRMLERAAAAVGVSLSVALESKSPLAVTARWGAWVAMTERGMSLKDAGRQLGGRDHSTVWWALKQVPARVSSGDAMLRASIEAARTLTC